MDLVKELRKFIRSTDASVMSKVANGLASVGYYDKKIREYVNLTSSLAVHQDKLTKFTSAVGEQDTGDDEKEVVDRLTGLCKQACFLASELPSGSLDTVLNTLYSRVISFLDRYLEAKGDEKEKLSLGSVQKLLAECSIAYPFKKELENYKSSLAQVMSEAVSLEKQTKMMQEMKLFLENSSQDSWKSGLATLRDRVAGAEGVLLPPERVNEVEQALKQFDELLLESVSKDPEMGLELEWVVEKLSGVARIDREAVSHRQRVALFMSSHLLKLQLSGACVEDILKQEDSRDLIGALMRWEETATPMAAEDGWGKEKLTDMLAESSKLVNVFKALETNGAMAEMESRIQALRAIAGGGADGQAWDVGLGDGASWEEVLAQAKQTILDKDQV